MRILLSALLISTLTLAGCGSIRNSRINPFNWFGNSRAEALPAEVTNPLLPLRNRFRRPEAVYFGTPVDTIKDLSIERVAGGALVRVKGIAATQGSYEVKLVPENDGEPVKGVLTLTLKAQVPNSKNRISTEASREVNTAHFLSDNDLEGARTIRVLGARNARSSRRR